MFSQTLLLLLLLQSVVVHKVSRSTFHCNICAFYFDNEHLYRFFTLSDIYGCRTFRNLWGASKCPIFFFSTFDSEYFSLNYFFQIFIYFTINNDFLHHNDAFRKK